MFERFDSFVNDRTVFADVLLAYIRWQGVLIPHLLSGGGVLVVARPHRIICAKRQGPVNYRDPVVRLGIGRSDLHMFLVERLRFLKLLGIVRSTRHLKQDGTNPVDCAHVLWVNVERISELLDRLASQFLICFARRSRNELVSVCGRKVQPCVQELRIQLLRALELRDGRVVLTVFEVFYTLVEYFACLPLFFRLWWRLLSL